jgi:hypothetical protein
MAEELDANASWVQDQVAAYEAVAKNYLMTPSPAASAA